MQYINKAITANYPLLYTHILPIYDRLRILNEFESFASMTPYKQTASVHDWQINSRAQVSMMIVCASVHRIQHI